MIPTAQIARNNMLRRQALERAHVLRRQALRAAWDAVEASLRRLVRVRAAPRERTA